MAPDLCHLERVRVFVEALEPGHALHVHCFAGISRSPAVASFTLACLNPALSDRAAVQHIVGVRPQALPNFWVLRHAHTRLGHQLTSAWKQQTGRA